MPNRTCPIVAIALSSSGGEGRGEEVRHLPPLGTRMEGREGSMEVAQAFQPILHRHNIAVTRL